MGVGDPKLGYGNGGPNPVRALQKAKKGLEFNNLTRRLASFWQFSSSKVE